MNALRKKLLDFKQRLSKGKMYSITLVIIGIIAGIGIYEYRQLTIYKQDLDNTYNRAFFDLTGYVQNLESLLLKSMVTSTPSKTSLTLKEVWHQSNLAQTNLGLLPLEQPVLSNTSRFLTQVGDFAFTLSQQTLNNKAIDNAQFKSLEDLHTYSESLKNDLFTLQNQITSGRIKWKSLQNAGNSTFSKTSKELPSQTIQKIDSSLNQFPSLIYDGPFSDHIRTQTPKGLSGNTVTVDEAKKNVEKFFGTDKISEINHSGKDTQDTLKTFNFSVKLKDSPEGSSCNLSVTETGGHVLWMLCNRPTDSNKIDISTAREKAHNFLKEHGFENMKDTYFVIEDKIATINFAATQENILIYPDLIKVKVSLDNSEIVGFESKGYYYSHHKRDIATPQITLEQAKKSINPRLEITSTNLVIIPTKYKSELLAYEFSGRLQDKTFLVYINAITGNEEDILIIIDSENGKLTI